MKAFDSIILLDYEERIKKDLENRRIDDKKAIEILCRHLAGTQIALNFEQIYSTIWGSQINLLKYLNSRVPTGDTADNLKVIFYETAAIIHPLIYAGYPFENYLYFLRSRTLIMEENGIYNITNLGRDFLVYMMQTGKSEARPY